MGHSIRVVYPRIMRRSSLVLVAAALVLVPLRSARAQVIGEAVELERTGRQAGAAVVYIAVLPGEATNPPALLGLDRVLPPLGRLPELLPLVRRGAPPAPPEPPPPAAPVRGRRPPP